MDRCDVVIVGGGPAGSSCAWALRNSGLDVVILDARKFPRDKACAGWITPAVLSTLAIDQAHYRTTRVLQPIRGFRLGMFGQAVQTIEYPEVVSHAIRRREFDEYLLMRSGARLELGRPVLDFRRVRGEWIVDDRIAARVLVGAGGHFCPVARRLCGEPAGRARVLVGQTTEINLERLAIVDHDRRPDLPELRFDPDLRGLGWALRKGPWMNLGYGHEQACGRAIDLARRVEAMIEPRRRAGELPERPRLRLRGHTYSSRACARAPVTVEGALLIGDAAGLARASSGEGIRAAVESGLLAAEVIADPYGHALADYARALDDRFGARAQARARHGAITLVPARWRARLAARLLAVPSFARQVVLDHWFLHTEQALLGDQPRR